MRYSYLQIEKYIADKITSLCEKRDISKYRLSQLSGISQSSLGRIMAQENLPSLITLEKICTALGVTLSQFFQEGNSENLTEKQKENSRYIFELFAYFWSPRSIDITVSCSFVLRSFHILKTSFRFSVRFSELPSWKNCDNVTPNAVYIFSSIYFHKRKYTRKKHKDTFVFAKVIFSYIVFIIP